MRWRQETGRDEAWSETGFGVYRVLRTPIESTYQGYQLWWYPSSTPTRAHHLGYHPTMPAAKRAAKAHLDSMQGPPPPTPPRPWTPTPGAVREGGSLHDRIAAALGWSARDVRSMSLHSLREMVRGQPKLVAEIDQAIRGGGYITGGGGTAREAGGHRAQSPYPEIERRGREVGRMTTPREAGYVLEPLALVEVQEVAVVMNLTVHSTFAGVREVARGAVEHVEVPIPLSIRAASLSGTPWAILAHNHPSGQPRPSRDDLALWHDAAKRFACAGLTLLDHLILARGAFYSCKWDAYWTIR